MGSEFQQIKIAVCGHIDHGKSTLIGRLLLDTGSLPDDKIKELQKIAKTFGQETQLAYLADQLKEERQKNITIETTQVFFKTRKRPYCLIDTPGHLEFIKNMLTGASQAQTALLLVDIHEGIADQTLRHAYLLSFLGLSSIIVVVNKMDLVDYSQKHFAETREELLALFSKLKINPTHILPVCAKQGENISRRSKKMPWFYGPSLIDALDALAVGPAEDPQAVFRFAVQDIYALDKENICVGAIASGTIKEGQHVFVLPCEKTAKVKAIKVFNKNKKSASAGENIGLTFTTDIPIKRGDILCAKADKPAAVKSFIGNIFWLSPTDLTQGLRVRLQCSTQTFDCEVSKILETMDPVNLEPAPKTTQVLKQNQTATIEFTLLTPAVLEKHTRIAELGRYTLENSGELCGAGTVLSTYP